MQRESESLVFNLEKGVVVEFSSMPGDIGKEDTKINSINGTISIMAWGEKNTLPIDREMMLMDNHIMPEMLSTKRSIIIGQGIKPFIVEVDEESGEEVIKHAKMPVEAARFFESCEFDTKYLEEAANQLILHANIPVGMMLSNDGSQIASMMSYKCRDIRAETRKFGEPVNQYWFGDYSEVSKGKSGRTAHKKYTSLPVAPPLKLKDKKTLKRGEVMYFVSDKMLFDGYYGHPTWWGGREWMQLSNVIAKFHLANIRNGYVLRYHIQVPKEAFLDKLKYYNALDADDNETVAKCLSDEKTEKQRFIDNLNSFLSGEENVGRALVTFFESTEEGKKIEGVKIEPLKVDLKDDSMLKLFDAANRANTNSAGLPLTLAGIETNGKWSSGTEMRNALEYFVKIKAPIHRKKLLEAWNYVWRYNGWDKKHPEIKWWFGDIVLAKLDDDKSGTKELEPEPVNG